MRKVYCIMLFTLWYAAAHSQQQPGVVTQIESIMSQYDEADNKAYFETLMHYYQHPIDLNKCNRSDLQALGILNQTQLDEFFSYRNLTGGLNSIYELQAIAEFDLATIKSMLIFVTVSDQQSFFKQFKTLFQSDKNYVIGKYSRITEPKLGYINGLYAGDPSQSQMRIRLINPGHISVGVTMQKDPGESIYSRVGARGPDFLSGHFYLQNDKILNQLAIGDFKLQYGQGLLLGSGFMIGKNAETITSIKQGTIGVMPYSSVTEYKFFRGLATRLKLTNNLKISLFYSNRHLDATRHSDLNLNAVTTIRNTGLHRTPTEIEGRNVQHEEVMGAVLTYSGNRFNTGLIALNSNFMLSVLPKPTIYNQHYFKGNKLTNFSFFADYSVSNFTIFGEMAKSLQGGLGWTLGMIASLGSHVDFSFLGRAFDRDFYSFYGTPFSEQSTTRNENGVYWGLKIRPVAKVEISGYFDIYKFPWLTSAVYAPSQGKELMGRINYSIDKSTKIFFQIKSEQREGKDASYNIPKSTLLKYIKTIVNFDYNLEAPLKFRTRLQWNQTRNEIRHEGMMIYQDVSYTWRKIAITGRFLLFDADILARLYTYEKDVLFSFNTQSFAGEGMRYYFMIKVKPIPNLSLRGKWAQTIYFDREVIGSGAEMINNSHKTQLTIQLKLNF